jgi:hypothetical protein
LKTIVETGKSPEHATDEPQAKNMEFRAWRINQQSHLIAGLTWRDANSLSIGRQWLGNICDVFVPTVGATKSIFACLSPHFGVQLMTP